MKKYLLFILLICGTSYLFAAGNIESNNLSNTIPSTEKEIENTITVTDVLNRQVTVKKQVKSVAYTHYSTSEALKILDAWDLVVARDGFTSDTIVFPNIDEIPALTPMMGNGFEPNLEILLDLKPDLLILEVIPMPGLQELIDKLDGIIPVVAVKTYDPNEMEKSFEILGKLLNKEKEAKKYIDWCNDIKRNTYLHRDGGIHLMIFLLN